MGRTEGALEYQRTVSRQNAADAVNLGHFQGFFRRHTGQYGRQAPGQHGFAAARGPVEQQVVETGGGYLQRPFGVVLAFDVGQVHGLGRTPAIVWGVAVG